MSRNRLLASALSLIPIVALTAATLQAAPPADKGKAGGKKAEGNTVDVDLGFSAMVSAGISSGDARALASRYGVTGGKPLPPGIRKNLARGKPLPPGIQKTRMPDSFIDELPRHEGYEWRQAGADLVLVASGSLVISDILEGVFD